ncbi:MAG: VUT family protein [Amaricoccus sp.]
MIQLLLYLATIPAANWMIGNFGTTCVPQGPCLVPVGFGLTAPSGVLLIGIALVLRDLVHRDLGARWAAAGVVAGSALSFVIAPPELALASFVAFAVSEALDQAVYTPLRHRRLVLAVIASGVVGAVADSALFLWLAFGSLDHITGQVVGKLWMVGAAAGFLWLRSQRRPAAAAS